MNRRLNPRPAIGRLTLIVCVVLTCIILLFTALLLFSPAAASSHREAPLIAKDAFADSTDVYAFVAPEDPDRIVLLASWIPFQSPEGGPNYWEWDQYAAYDLYVDNDGDAVPDLTYTLNSQVTVADPYTFLYNTGPVTSLNDPDWNRRQVYSVTQTVEGGAQNVVVGNVVAPPVNIGSKSTPNYQALVDAAIYTHQAPSGEIKVFAGQTDDGFFVDLQVFDLLTLRGQAPPIGYGNENNIPLDSVSGFNVHTLAMEFPIAHLTQGDEPVLGIWAATRRTPLGSTTPVQVSRLGMPLVNEVVIPMGLKDAFNAIPPSADLSIYSALQESVEDPEIGNLLCTLYGVPLPADSDDDCDTEYTSGTPRSGRGDIFDIFLTGMVLANEFTIQTAGGPVTLTAGYNVNQPDGVVPAEMLRINTAISGSTCAPTPHRLGLLGGDACGFPNGRRLTDDVVDIELLAVAGAAYQALDGRDASFLFDPAFFTVLNDGVVSNDRPLSTAFPYIGTAQSGENHFHENILKSFAPIIQSAGQATQAAGQMARQNPAATAVTLGGATLFTLPALVWMRSRRKE